MCCGLPTLVKEGWLAEEGLGKDMECFVKDGTFSIRRLGKKKKKKNACSWDS